MSTSIRPAERIPRSTRDQNSATVGPVAGAAEGDGFGVGEGDGAGVAVGVAVGEGVGDGGPASTDGSSDGVGAGVGADDCSTTGSDVAVGAGLATEPQAASSAAIAVTVAAARSSVRVDRRCVTRRSYPDPAGTPPRRRCHRTPGWGPRGAVGAAARARLDAIGSASEPRPWARGGVHDGRRGRPRVPDAHRRRARRRRVGRLARGPQPGHRAVVGRVPDGTEADVDRAVAAARAAFEDGRWRRR